MEKTVIGLIEKQKRVLFYYSPYNFIRDINPEIQFNLFVKEKMATFFENTHPDHFIYRTTKNEKDFFFLYQHLQWDTNFFKRKCFKLYTVLYSAPDIALLTEAIISFRTHLCRNENVSIFIDIPSEDIFLIQCLGKAGFKMVETRLHFYKDQLAQYNEERYPVRKATIGDAVKIREVARNSRNEYDRIHADFDFANETADDYLGTYAESAVKGYCDAVLVPAEPGIEVDAFLAISDLKQDAALLQCGFARVVLTAVGPSNKGWHKKLVSETIYYAKDQGASYVLMTTQSTNRAVFRTSEKLGFRLGGTSHILSYNNR